MRILITGATGFVGRALITRAASTGEHQLRCVIRRGVAPDLPGVEIVNVPEIGAETQWAAPLRGVDCVVHLAAKVHDLKAHGPDSLDAYRAVNTAGTVNLARQAAGAGVKRFIFLSSIKVNGEEGRFRETDPAAPVDSYGTSKHEAEIELARLARTTPMEVVVVRPPLVYGPGVKANFRSLMRAVARGVPLPFGAVRNKRSFVAVDNLVDFILVCASHAGAANETFFVSDGEDLSTTELLRRVARALGTTPRLLRVPPTILMGLATILGRRTAMRRLLGTLQVDISKAHERLGWSPPVSIDEGLRRTAMAGK